MRKSSANRLPQAPKLTHLEVTDVLEDEGVVDVDSLADLVVHGIDVGLVNGHALLCQRGGVVDGDVVELRVVLPVLVYSGRVTGHMQPQLSLNIVLRLAYTTLHFSFTEANLTLLYWKV